MSLPKKSRLSKIGSAHKSDSMKDIKILLEKAKQDLIVAQQENNVARVKKLQQSIADLTGTVERNR